MATRFPLSVIFVLAVLVSAAAQPSQMPQSTTLDSAQIVYPDPSGSIDKIQLVSPTRTAVDPDYLEYSTPVKTYYINVALGMGSNQFVLITFKNNVYVATHTINILRVAPDKPVKGKKTASVEVEVENTSAAADRSSFLTDAPQIAVSSSRPRSADVSTEYGPNVSEPTAPAVTTKTPFVRPVSASVAEQRSSTAEPSRALFASTATESDSANTKTAFNPNIRLMFGFEQVGASSAVSKGRPFADLMLNIPIGRVSKNAENLFWANFKLTSAPNQVLPDFGSLTPAAIGGFFGSNQAGKVNDLVQAFEARIGWEARVNNRFGLIAGVGATSPLSSEKTAVAYKIPRLKSGEVHPAFKDIFGRDQDFAGIDNLVLTSGDRDRFMRNWFVGGRLYYPLFKSEGVYPLVFELTYGQDEVITNKLVGRVLKFDSLVPIPINGLKFLYFGASFNAKLTRKVNTTTFPFFLEPATNVNLFANNNYIRNTRDIPELNSDRDGFSFRFGVDLLRLLKIYDEPNSEKATLPISEKKKF